MRWLMGLLWVGVAWAGVPDYYRPLGERRACCPPEGIDFVYMINLDQRPERWQSATAELARWAIFPQRFPGIYGWTLGEEVLNGMGVVFQHGMWNSGEWVMHFPRGGGGQYEFLPLTGADYGKTVFSGWTVVGTLGCTLSHLSVLADAYEQGYEVVWVLEDDIVVAEDPHVLGALVAELNEKVGDWDLFYTDFDHLVANREGDVRHQLRHLWRPDMPPFNLDYFLGTWEVSENVMKIGNRSRAHSIVYSRRGIEKVIRFYETHGNFLAYDQEVCLIPGIQLYVARRPIVTVHEVNSDTRHRYFEK